MKKLLMSATIGLLACIGTWAQQTQDVVTVTAQVDALFTQWQKAVPPPVSLSDANGISMSTPHGFVTYNQLHALAAALSKMGPNTIPRLVHWAQSPEPYQRQIAVFALIDLTGQDSGNYAVPSMCTSGHISYARIMTTVWRYARDRGVPLAAHAMPVVVPPEDGQIDPRVFGQWRLVNANSPSQNIFETYAIESNRFVVTSWDNARGQGADQIRHTYSHPVARYTDLGDGWVGVHVTGERLDITPPDSGQTEPLIFRYRMDESLHVAFRLTTPDTMWIDAFARARASDFHPYGDCFERIGPLVLSPSIMGHSPDTVSRDEKAHVPEKVEHVAEPHE
ncbi:MAG: hypothetical protein WCJ02_06860 [bacterium]